MLINLSLISYVAWWVHAAYANDCTLVKSDASEKDKVAMLKKLDPLKGQNFTTSDDPKEKGKKPQYEYTIGICSRASDKKDSLVGAVQKQLIGENIYVLGFYNETKIMGGTDWVLLTYKGGDNYGKHCGSKPRQAHVMLLCDHESQGTKLRVVEEHKSNSTDGPANSDDSECYYLFELRTSVVCVVPPVPQEALSGGSIFCIIFFTVLGIYLIIGFLYQRIVVGAKGLEQIPNYNFWKDFGQLQADGCDFVCRCGERQDAKMYRGIDDQLLNPEPRDDRDDRLLPM